jgi:hypothetical protein
MDDPELNAYIVSFIVTKLELFNRVDEILLNRKSIIMTNPINRRIIASSYSIIINLLIIRVSLSSEYSDLEMFSIDMFIFHDIEI